MWRVNVYDNQEKAMCMCVLVPGNVASVHLSPLLTTRREGESITLMGRGTWTEMTRGHLVVALHMLSDDFPT